MKKTKAELKDMIVDLRVQIVQMSIPNGHCPYSYYRLKNTPSIDCNTVGCQECSSQFISLMRELITKEVEQL